MNLRVIHVTIVLNTVFIYDMSQWQHAFTEQREAMDGALGNTQV